MVNKNLSIAQGAITKQNNTCLNPKAKQNKKNKNTKKKIKKSGMKRKKKRKNCNNKMSPNAIHIFILINQS